MPQHHVACKITGMVEFEKGGTKNYDYAKNEFECCVATGDDGLPASGTLADCKWKRSMAVDKRLSVPVKVDPSKDVASNACDSLNDWLSTTTDKEWTRRVATEEQLRKASGSGETFSDSWAKAIGAGVKKTFSPLAKKWAEGHGERIESVIPGILHVDAVSSNPVRLMKVDAEKTLGAVDQCGV